MNNLEKILEFIQHKSNNSLYKKNNMYDVKSDLNLVDEIADNLWYTFNNNSIQLPFADKALYPIFLNNKNFDLMFKYTLQLLFHIDCKNFVLLKQKVDTVGCINNFNNFENNNFFILFYDNSNSNITLIMKFLQSYRNALAHGGFNKIILNNGDFCTLYFAADYSNCAENGFQLLIKLNEKDKDKCEYQRSVYYSLIEIFKKNCDSVFSLFIKNLELIGYEIVNRYTNNSEINVDINLCEQKFCVVKKDNLYKEIYFIENDKKDEIILKINNILKSKSPNYDVDEIIFYLYNNWHNLDVNKIKDECLDNYIKNISNNNLIDTKKTIQDKVEILTRDGFLKLL